MIEKAIKTQKDFLLEKIYKNIQNISDNKTKDFLYLQAKKIENNTIDNLDNFIRECQSIL